MCKLDPPKLGLEGAPTLPTLVDQCGTRSDILGHHCLQAEGDAEVNKAIRRWGSIAAGPADVAI